MNQYCQVLISAPTKKTAEQIADQLLKSKLVAGILITFGDSRYWWKNAIVTRKYYNISAFSRIQYKQKVISVTKKYHPDKVPIISFIQIDGNKEFLHWIEESITL